MATRAMVLALLLTATPMGCGGRSVDVERDDGGGGSGATGGADSRGGNSTGGNSIGGNSIGGNSIGGSSAGGGSSGGAATGGTSTSGGSATAGVAGMAGAECDPLSPLGGTSGTGNDIVILPDCSGWIDRTGLQEVVTGGWYAFGDQYPGPYDERCLAPGMHRPEECSIIWSPRPPPAIRFPQAVRGVMCTTGEVATVLPCAPTVNTAGCPDADYWHMMGAGIGVDFNAEGHSRDSPRHPWDPAPYRIVGFSFEIDLIPALGLRVEIPMVLTDAEASAAVPPLPSGSTTESHPDGSPYWGATYLYPNSPVAIGTNVVLFYDIRPPRTNYEFDPSRMLGIQFHVPTTTRIPKSAYGFCISNLTLIVE